MVVNEVQHYFEVQIVGGGYKIMKVLLGAGFRVDGIVIGDAVGRGLRIGRPFRNRSEIDDGRTQVGDALQSRNGATQSPFGAECCEPEFVDASRGKARGEPVVRRAIRMTGSVGTPCMATAR